MLKNDLKGKKSKLIRGALNKTQFREQSESLFLTSGFVYKSKEEVPFWWEKLTKNSFFKSALSKRWRQLRNSTLSDEVVLEMVEEFAGELEIAQENNFDKWSLLGQKEVWPNYYIGNSHREEVEYLKIWISNRAKWLDEKWKN